MLAENTGDLTALERRVDEIFQELRQVPQLD
jgi:hypothetical protein